MIISLGLTPLLARKVLGCDVSSPQCTDPTRGYELLAVIYGAVASAIIIFMALGIHENPDVVEETRPRFIASIIEIITNRYFWTVGVVSACYGAAMSLVLGGLQLYVDHSLGGGARQATILQVTVILGSIGFLAVWTVIVRQHGAART